MLNRLTDAFLHVKLLTNESERNGRQSHGYSLDLGVDRLVLVQLFLLRSTSSRLEKIRMLASFHRHFALVNVLH